ncbi:hypothetical protein C2S51_004408 [Perilla frutescens var. frutescens]|nr:hypothetical protein C2S51_004408 [Perilla frutescens var. frutescens]
MRLSKSRGINFGLIVPTVSYCTFLSTRPLDSQSMLTIRRLEAQGIHRKQAEAVTSQMTQVLNVSMEYILENAVSKAEMQRVVMATETNLVKLKSEVKIKVACAQVSMANETNIMKLKSEVQKIHCNPQSHAFLVDVSATEYYQDDIYDNDGQVQWIVDSGATNHITNDLHNLSLKSAMIGERLVVGNGHQFPIAASGQTQTQNLDKKHTAKWVIQA